jgi:SAM-dependent methyltransferase
VRRGVFTVVRRQRLDDLLDWVRFRVDTFPRRAGVLRFLPLPELATVTGYQDLPWIGMRTSRRGSSSESRWHEMLPLLEECHVRTAVDIGANVGWFLFAFDRLGIPAVGVEKEPRHIRVGLYAQRKLGRPSRIGFLTLDVEPATVRLVPPADCVVFLSVWHHIVRDQGLEAATDVLAQLWERTGKILFFETGEREIPDWWGLPAMDPNPREWLEGYLASTCGGATVRYLGVHDGGLEEAGGNRVMRNLFAVIR